MDLFEHVEGDNTPDNRAKLKTLQEEQAKKLSLISKRIADGMAAADGAALARDVPQFTEPVDLWLVVRDRRGGLDWASYRFARLD